MKTSRNSEKFTKDDLLKLKTRRLIYQVILKNPGIHFREICRRLNLARGTVNYHTLFLEKRGLITAKYSSRYILYYVTDKYGKNEKNLLQNLRLDTPRNIIFYIIMWGSGSQNEISKELKKHPTTIEFYMKRLVDLEIIEFAPNVDNTIYLNTKNSAIMNRDKNGRERLYRIKDPRKLYDLLILYYNKNYYKSDVADVFFSYIEEMYTKPNRVFPNKLKTFKQALDEFEETFYEICPHPYHC